MADSAVAIAAVFTLDDSFMYYVACDNFYMYTSDRNSGKSLIYDFAERYGLHVESVYLDNYR